MVPFLHPLEYFSRAIAYRKMFHLQSQMVIPEGHTSTCAGASVGAMCEAGFWPKLSGVGAQIASLRSHIVPLSFGNDRERLKSLEKFP
jgi:hypothetical protein